MSKRAQNELVLVGTRRPKYLILNGRRCEEGVEYSLKGHLLTFLDETLLPVKQIIYGY